jgi:hypothetical protein
LASEIQLEGDDPEHGADGHIVAREAVSSPGRFCGVRCEVSEEHPMIVLDQQLDG